MPKLDYKTILVWSKDKKQVFAFYKYNNGIGYIPADISVTKHGKIYTTSGMMTIIANNYKNIIKKNFILEEWYKNGSIDKTKFINYYKSII